jgi:glycosyltransferase involved in cell wall biosynthesis
VTVAGIVRVKDEADIIAASMRHLLAQVDHIVVEDNGSTDGTLDILRQLPVELLHDDTVGYYQSAAMSRLADYARQMHGATWIVPADADELWEATDGRRMADVLAELPEPVHVATAADSAEPDPVARIGWRRWDALGLPKVACRAVEGVTIHQGNHSASFIGVDRPPVVTGLLRVRHFPYRSPEQFVRKAVNGGAAYAATDLDPGIGAHWRQYAAMIAEHGEQAGEDWFREHFFVEDPESDPTLIYDPAP